jgi:hypothetical protein
MKMDVLDPRGIAPSDVKPAARRPASLRGLRIGVLDNGKPNADVLLIRVAELLAERTGAGPIRRWTKPGASHPATNHDEIAAAVDVVLTGSAD